MDYYQILGVRSDSEREVIDGAYRALIKKYHPDTWRGDAADAERRSKEINEAYHVLRDEQRRREYDLRSARAKQQAQNGRSGRASSDGSENDRRKASSQDPKPHPKPTNPRTPPKSVRSGQRRTAIELFAFCLIFFVLVGILARYTSSAAGTTDAATPTSDSDVAQHRVPAGTQAGDPNSASQARWDGFTRVFCITNNTLRAVDYTVTWGQEQPVQFELRPGYSQVHTSKWPVQATVRWVDLLPGDEAESTVTTRVTNTDTSTCAPNYAFDFKDAPIPGYAHGPFDRFGLYAEN